MSRPLGRKPAEAAISTIDTVGGLLSRPAWGSLSRLRTAQPCCYRYRFRASNY